MSRTPLELACAAKALAHWLAAGLPLAGRDIRLSFGAPFSILCALSLVNFVIEPFAAAASLRHGLGRSGIQAARHYSAAI